ncbi:MAG: co-chaperone GroES [Isosphaeraceae bacterium]|nr:co-chaperone GroES [Isosphaeraceae bacterium]
MLPIDPLGDHVVLKPLDAATTAGLVLPAMAIRDQPRRGVVLAVGPGRRTEEGQHVPPLLRAGDLVLYGSRAGTDVRIGSVELLLIRESDVIAHVLE